MDEEVKSRVYILTDAEGRILQIEGDASLGNFDDLSKCILLDEGDGDKYYHAQHMYFDGELLTEDGVPRWVYENGAARLRTETEIAADRAAMPEPEPTETEKLRADVDFIMAMEGWI